MNLRIFGVLSLVVGIILLILGIMGSQSTGQQVASSVTGQFTRGVMWYIIGGSILTVYGGLTAFRKR